MADMFDCGMNQFRRWSRGDAHAIRWFGQFDQDRTAAQQWVINDCAGKLSEHVFPAFERGWTAAQAEYRAAIAAATGEQT